MAVAKLKKNHTRLFQCLMVDVVKALDWTENDVRLNKGTRVDDKTKPAQMKNLESKLLCQRIFEVSRFPLGRYLSQYSLPRKPSSASDTLALARKLGQFPLSYVQAPRSQATRSQAPRSQATRPNKAIFRSNKAIAKDDTEFLAFYTLVSSYIPTAPRFQLKSQSVKATAVKGIFIHPPFLLGDSVDQLVCDE